jgi:hypothetical protein
MADPPTVTFDIKPSLASSADSELFDCTYLARNKTARFRLRFKQLSPMKGELPMASAEGVFISVPGSDNSSLLEDLKAALEAATIPSSSARIRELPFDAVVLGMNESRNSNGGYVDNPHGDWMTIKLFFPKGGDDGEVFLNINRVLRKAEFSIKDSDYGDYLLSQFAGAVTRA